jgi:hypothetical protein
MLDINLNIKKFYDYRVNRDSSILNQSSQSTTSHQQNISTMTNIFKTHIENPPKSFHGVVDDDEWVEDY